MDFSLLPLDIHTLVLGMLSPSDIFALRKTCKTLLNATSQRIIWLKALEKVCYDNTLYRYSFPLHEMTLLELEYAAMAPKKWETLTLKGDFPTENEIPSFATHTLQPQYDAPVYSPAEHPYLVPGGRFLVVLQKGYLTLWDLGYVGLQGAEMKPIAQLRTDCGSYTVHTSPDGVALRVLGVTYRFIDDEFSKHEFDVIEIYPWKAAPEFTIIASLAVASGYYLNFTSVCGNRLALVYGRIIKIWDFVADEWATWNTGNYHRQILMTSRSMVLIGMHDLSVWDVPKLAPDAQTLSKIPEPTTFSTPRGTYVYERGYRPPETFTCGGLCDWYTGSPQPLWFDIVDTLEDVSELEVELSRFEADSSNSQPLERPIKSIATIHLIENDHLFLSPYRVCGDSVIIPFCSSLGIYCHIGSSSGHHNRVIPLRFVTDVTHREFSFCPVAGRLAYMLPGGDVIEIVDFYSPYFLDNRQQTGCYPAH